MDSAASIALALRERAAVEVDGPVAQWESERLTAFYERHADPQWDVWRGGTAKAPAAPAVPQAAAAGDTFIDVPLSGTIAGTLYFAVGKADLPADAPAAEHSDPDHHVPPDSVLQ